MTKILYSIVFLFFFTGQIIAQTPVIKDWKVNGKNQIQLDINKEKVLPYSDNIEMSGKRVDGIISYSIDNKGKLTLERKIFFPQLHEFKNDNDSWFHNYRAYLQDKYDDGLLPKIYINKVQFVPGAIKSVIINGMLNFEHQPSIGGLQLSRSLFPSMSKRMFVEMWTLKNTSGKEMNLVAGNTSLNFEDFGNKGKYSRKIISNAPSKKTLQPGEKFSFSLKIMAKMEGEKWPSEKAEEVYSERKEFLKKMTGSLQLETPDSTLNTLFGFSKIRASESIFESELGLIHSPGGGRYYVGIWANDQAEYASPFFPYLGYKEGNQSAINCYRAFAGEINSEYKNIRYSFEIEGLVKPFLKDRGDAAMIAYGATHFAMVNGDIKDAKELWPLIEWCLEYCNRKLNTEGVVSSESDEMEGRVETGNANLSTSSLYYGAINYAIDLGKSLGIKKSLIKKYKSQSKILKTNIEKYFSANIEGLNTYKYYKENNQLRHWICLPLVVGINNRKDATIKALFDKLWTDNGVLVEKNDTKESKIFWDRGTLYALRGAFIAGETDESLKKLDQFSHKRLLGDRVPYVVEASPEGSMAQLSAESALYCRIFTEGIFGINPTGLNSFKITPRLPEHWNKMALRNIKAFKQNFDIEVKRLHNKISVKILSGNKILLSKNIKSGTSVNFTF